MRFLLIALLLSSSAVSRADELTVSAAISLKEALQQAAANYTARTGTVIHLNLGATGQLMAQIRQGAPVDVFISAADAPMDELEKLNLVDPSTRITVAGNILVLVARADASSPPQSFADLANPSVRRIAVGHPDTVPAGLYARQTLASLGLTEKLTGKLVYGQTVRQVLDYVEQGEADAGIVYQTDAPAARQKLHICSQAPDWTHDPINYPAAAVRTVKSDAASRFLQFLTTPHAQTIFKAHGFSPPTARKSASSHNATSPQHESAGILSSLLLSLQIGIAATALAAIVAVPLAFTLARYRLRFSQAVDAALTLPLILPPTVVGYFIIVSLGARSPIGRLLSEKLGYSLIFHWHGAVIAAALVALPLLYLPAKAAFASVDRELEDISRLQGANVLQMFWHVSLPMARSGIAAGLVLAFARALGEFGATMMVLGNLPHRQTLPISIYTDYISGNLAHATAAVLALSAISMAVVFICHRSLLAHRG